MIRKLATVAAISAALLTATPAHAGPVPEPEPTYCGPGYVAAGYRCLPKVNTTSGPMRYEQ